MQEELTAMQPELIRTSAETDQMMIKIEGETVEVDAKRALVSADEKVANDAAAAAKAIKVPLCVCVCVEMRQRASAELTSATASLGRLRGRPGRGHARTGGCAVSPGHPEALGHHRGQVHAEPACARQAGHGVYLYYEGHQTGAETRSWGLRSAVSGGNRDR